MKNIILALTLIFLVGCSDKPKENAKQEVAPSEPQGKIEIVENEHAQDTKVAIKAVDENQSKSYYYDYNNGENKEAKEEKTYTKLDAYSRIRSPYEMVEIRLLANKLSKNFILKCSPCHDDYANGIIGPSLLAKDGDFIYQRIIDYKSGAKNNPLMRDLVTLMSKEDLKAIADEIATFNETLRKKQEGK